MSDNNAKRQPRRPRPATEVDLTGFAPREVARLLAQRIFFGLGHYADDDPYTLPEPPGQEAP